MPFNGSETALDLRLLVAIREGRDCGGCLEEQLAGALNATTRTRASAGA